MTDEETFYSVADIQRKLGVSRKTVYRLLKKREFNRIMIGNRFYRISRKSFDEWLEENLRRNRDIIDGSDSFGRLCDSLSRINK